MLVEFRLRPRLVGLTVLALLAAAVAVGTASASPPVTGTDANGAYLALGDSVAFGYVPSQAVPAPNYFDAHSFVGYPEYLAQKLGERVWNASCPGETTTSLLTGADSNGCEDGPGSSSGYRTAYPLHVEYQGTQMQDALDYLARHPHTRLVTIDVGANDFFLCEETTADHCSSPAELGALGQTLQTNLATILGKLRSTAYRGPVVVLTYYSLSYTDKTQLAVTGLLNHVLSGVATAYGATVADGFGAFETASASSGGDPCAAGLLIKLPDGTCNVHPSALGQQVLAGAIANAIGA